MPTPPKLSIKLGDGMTFDGNSISVDTGENVSIVTSGTEDQQGLYVENLKGEQGPNGGSTCDEWTCIPGTGYPVVSGSSISNFVDGNREVVELIFACGMYKAADYTGNGIDWTSTPKTVSDIIDSINYPISTLCCITPTEARNNKTSYHPNAGELIELVSYPTIRNNVTRNGARIYVEAHSRIADNQQETMAMFVIREITYKAPTQQGVETFFIESMRLSCLYVNSDFVNPGFIEGKDYTGDTTLTPIS